MKNADFSRAYLGLGANLGDPIEQLISARSMLFRLPTVMAGRCSSFYSSSPVGYSQQADFINCVIELDVTISAIELLDQMQLIETMLGRQRVVGHQNAPRLIDIDLLLFGDQQIMNERLIVPHPRMTKRLFVLHPLLELINDDAYKSSLEEGEFDGQLIQRLMISPENITQNTVFAMLAKK